MNERISSKSEVRSWIGIVYAVEGHLLLDGRKYRTSSRFENRWDAMTWANGVKRGNRLAGRRIGQTKILPSTQEPEIPATEVVVH